MAHSATLGKGCSARSGIPGTLTEGEGCCDGCGELSRRSVLEVLLVDEDEVKLNMLGDGILGSWAGELTSRYEPGALIVLFPTRCSFCLL